MSQLSKWLLSGSTPLWAPRRGRTWTWRKSWGPKMTCRWSSKCHRSRRTQIVSIVLVRWNQSNWLNKERCPRTRGSGYDGRHVLPRAACNGRASPRRKELYFQLPLQQLHLQHHLINLTSHKFTDFLCLQLLYRQMMMVHEFWRWTICVSLSVVSYGNLNCSLMFLHSLVNNPWPAEPPARSACSTALLKIAPYTSQLISLCSSPGTLSKHLT